MRDAIPDIHFDFELPEADWPNSFSILTAYNPLNKRLTEGENKVVNNNLFDELRHLPQVFKITFGNGICMKNSEPGFGSGARLHTLLELAACWDQHGLYLIVGDKLSYVPCDSDLNETIIPGGFRQRVLKPNGH